MFGTKSLIAMATAACCAGFANISVAQADSAGPALTVPADQAAAALVCPAAFTDPGRSVVLLVHGSSGDGWAHYSEGLGRVLTREGRDWCMVNFPDRALGDIQTNSEFVVAAVRTLAAQTGRPVSLVGYSQGALEARWAVKWWPDIAATVDRVVTLEGANQGTETGALLCKLPECAVAATQYNPHSQFIAALNSGPLPAGPVYTAVGSNNDLALRPLLHGDNYFIPGNDDGNVLVQDVCPGRIVDHVTALFDAVELGLVAAALDAPGQLDLGGIDRSVCDQLWAPGVDGGTALRLIEDIYVVGFAGHFGVPDPSILTTREPPLRPYVTQ